MVSYRNNDIEPDMRLVELQCRNGHTTVPMLQRSVDLGQLGAYCSECRIWVKWVPQNERWLALESTQTHRYSTGHVPSETTTLPEFNDSARNLFSQAVADIAAFCHQQAQAMGFMDKERSLGDMLTLINTEMSELFEAHRHNTLDQPSEHIPAFTQAEEEWADVLVRVFCHATEHGVSTARLGEAFVAKLEFNRTRGYRHGNKVV